MRVIEKEKLITEIEVILKDYNVCDKCNCVIKLKDNHDAFKCEFIYKTGYIFPESSSGATQEMELCQKCAVELVTLLKNNGYKVILSEWS